MSCPFERCASTPRIRIVFWCKVCLSINERNNWSGYTSEIIAPAWMVKKQSVLLGITPQKKGTVTQHKATREGVHITIISILLYSTIIILFHDQETSLCYVRSYVNYYAHQNSCISSARVCPHFIHTNRTPNLYFTGYYMKDDYTNRFLQVELASFLHTGFLCFWTLCWHLSQWCFCL